MRSAETRVCRAERNNWRKHESFDLAQFGGTTECNRSNVAPYGQKVDSRGLCLPAIGFFGLQLVGQGSMGSAASKHTGAARNPGISQSHRTKPIIDSPVQLERIAEAYRRGVLPEEKKALYEEAIRRRLLPPTTHQSIDPAITPDKGGPTERQNAAKYSVRLDEILDLQEGSNSAVPQATRSD